MPATKTISDLLRLSHELGKPEHGLAILGEGNISAAVNEQTFLVKASGTCLSTLTEQAVVEMSFAQTLAILDADLDDDATHAALLAARSKADAPKPSVETTFHAWLLRQAGVNVVAHTHPLEVNKILCSVRCFEFASGRMFPDSVVYCGTASLLVDYVDPGTHLAETIRDHYLRFQRENGFSPKVILLRNHGLIAVGPTPAAVLATTLMTEKYAAVFNGACALGNPIFMPAKEVHRINTRCDELHRRKQMMKS